MDHILGTSLDLAIWMPRSIGGQDSPQKAIEAVLDEIHRLSQILNTRNPNSEIRCFERNEAFHKSRELDEVLQLYKLWELRTGGVLSIRSLGRDTQLNVDALGKAYIIDHAAAAARNAVPDLEGLLLNIGGDIVMRGHTCELGIADPEFPYDNGNPITRFVLKNGAVATSGAYARGAHLVDGRTGKQQHLASSATVVARDVVTANALATTLCIMDAEEGMRLVEQTEGAEALRIAPHGAAHRTSGFSQMERFRKIQLPAASNWPMDYQVTIAVTLTNPDPRADRPYLAAWVEDSSGKLVRAIVLWGSKSKYYSELSSFWIITGGSESLL